MINSQTYSNDDHHSSSETNNESLNDNSNNQNDEEDCSSRINNNDNSNKEITKLIHDGKVPKPDDERKLFVGQLSSDITKEDLRKYFSKFGTIEDVTIKYDVPGGRARGFAFILFDQKESIQKVLHVQIHTINQCQIDPKPAHRRPPVTNPVKKIFIGQLPTDFVEQDLSDYFSQFGIIDTIELPMDREKSVRRPFGFVSFLSEKTAEEVLRQQRHSINGASIEVRPAKPRPNEQQQQQQQQQHQHQHHQQQQQQQFQQYQQQYQYGEYFLPHPHHNTFITTSTIPHQSMINIHSNQNSYYTQNNNNYQGQIDQWSQSVNNGNSYWNPTNNELRNNTNNNTSISQWSTANNSALSSVNSNNNVYGTLGNSASSSSSPSVYSTQNPIQSVYHSNGINPQGQYPHSNYSNQLQSSYGGAYPSSSQIIPSNDPQSPSSSSTWNQYTAVNLANGGNPTAYDPNMFYASYYSNLLAQQYYSQQQQQSLGNQSQNQVSIEQNYSPNGYPTSSNGGLDKNYQHIPR